MLLLKPWLRVSTNAIPWPCLPRDHFCHQPGPHLFLQRLLLTKSKSKDLGHFPMLSLSLSSHFDHSFASPPLARKKGRSLLLPAFGISLVFSSSHLPLTEQAWPPCSTCLRDGDTSVPLSSVVKVLLQHGKHICLWFPLGRLQRVAVLSPHLIQPAPPLSLAASLLPACPPLTTVLFMLLSSASSMHCRPGREQSRCCDCVQRRAEMWGQEVRRTA